MKRSRAIETLFPFQKDGAAWLAQRRFALLADGMGLGKTAQAIVAADAINAERVLILCPASVRINWLREFEKFSVLGGNSLAILETASLTKLRAPRIITCSYDLAIRNEVNSALRSWLISSPRSVLIPDEVHFLKSVDAKRSHAVLAKGGIIHHASRTWALSGTPAPNHLAETYPLLRCFGVWRNSYDAFVTQFCKTRHTPYGTIICGNRNIPEFRRLIAPIILRRKMEDVMSQIPPIRYGDVIVEPGPVDLEVEWPEYYMLTNREPALLETLAKERALVESIIKFRGTGADGLAAINAVMDRGVWHKSVSLRRYVGLQKVKGVVDLVTDELNSGLDKIVLFAHHTRVIEGLRDGLSAFGAVALYGETNPNARQRNIDRFANNPKCRVFVGNIKAAGVAIDGLQNQCCNVMFVEKVSVPGDMAQAIMRVRRNGQTRPVLVRSVRLANDEIFDRIERALFRKTKDLIAAFD